VAKFPSDARKVKAAVADRVNQQAGQMKTDAIEFARKISPSLVTREEVIFQRGGCIHGLLLLSKL
jgi:hypothetical protein